MNSRSMAALSQPVAVKRVYEAPASLDGTRVLVEGRWPRGLSKRRAAIDIWMRELAPSTELQQWFQSKSAGWLVFRKQYLKELRRPEATEALKHLYRLAYGKVTLTLLFASSDGEHNNAIILKDLLEGMRKPPTGTGPGALRSLRDGQAKRMPR